MQQTAQEIPALEEMDQTILFHCRCNEQRCWEGEELIKRINRKNQKKKEIKTKSKSNEWEHQMNQTRSNVGFWHGCQIFFFLLFFSFYFFSSICQKRSTFHQNAHRQGHNELRLPHWHIQCTLRHNWLQRQVKKKDRRRRLNFHLFHSITWPYWNKSKMIAITAMMTFFKKGRWLRSPIMTKCDFLIGFMMIVISLTNRWRHLRKRGEIQVNHRGVIFWEQFCDIMIRYEVDITYVVVFAWFQSDFNRFSSYSFFADTPAATLLHPMTSPPKKHHISSQKWPGKGLEHTDYFRKFLRWRERFFVFFSTKKNWGHRFILNSPYPSS